MNLDNLLLLVKAGYSKDEIASMTDTEHEKKSDTEHEKKSDTEHEKMFDYDKLAETIISKMQANNRSENLDKNKNSTDDWLSQLSLKF